MSDWVRIPLGELVDVIDPHPSHRAPDAVVQGIPFVGIGDIREDGSLIEGKGRIVSEKIFDEHIKRYQISDRTIGFGRVATIGKVISFRNPTTKFVVSPTMAVLEPKPGTNRDFILHALQSEDIQEQIDKLLTGSTRSSLGIELLRKLTILHPASAVAQKISNILNSVSNQIGATQALIDKYTAIKQGMTADLFSRGIDPETKALRPTFEEAPELYHKTPLGMLPKGWGVVPASTICERVIDCKNRTPPEHNEGFAVIKTSNIKNGELIADSLTFTDEHSYHIWTARGVPQAGDVVITREAPVGESFLITDEMPSMCLGQRTMLYRPDPEAIQPMFMYFATRSPRFLKKLIDMAGGSTVGHVRVGDIKDMVFPKPNLSEQELISQACLAISDKLRTEKEFLEKLISQKSGLMQDLLTGKVPVPA